MSNPNDAALEGFKTKYTASFGAGVIPWSAIIAALAALLGSCPTPTPAAIKEQSVRPLVQIRMRRRLRAEGVDAALLDQSVDAAVAFVKSASDPELHALWVASKETE